MVVIYLMKNVLRINDDVMNYIGWLIFSELTCVKHFLPKHDNATKHMQVQLCLRYLYNLSAKGCIV